MYRCFLALFFCVVLAGCGSKPVSKIADDKPPFDVPKNWKPNISDSERPSSPDELKTQFLSKIKQGLYTPFIDLAYWQDLTDAEKDAYLQGPKRTYSQDNLTHRAKPMKDDDVSIAEIADPKTMNFYPVLDGDSKVHQPPVTHLLSVRAYFSADQYVDVKYGVGSKDGRYYLSTLHTK